MEKEINDLKSKLKVYEQSEKFKMVSEKESIFSYLAGRDERYDLLQKYVDIYNAQKQKNENLDDISKKLEETVGKY
jgi:hypothetical protein